MYILIQWTLDLVDFKGPKKFVFYSRSLLLTISYNKKIKGKYFQGTFLFVYYRRSSLIAVVAKCGVHSIMSPFCLHVFGFQPRASILRPPALGIWP